MDGNDLKRGGSAWKLLEMAGHCLKWLKTENSCTYIVGILL